MNSTTLIADDEIDAANAAAAADIVATHATITIPPFRIIDDNNPGEAFLTASTMEWAVRKVDAFAWDKGLNLRIEAL